MESIPLERIERRASVDEREERSPVEGLDRRSLVLNVAASLFAERGYYSSSMGDICEGSGIAKPTLYHYFPSKAAILFEILSDYIESLISAAELPERHTLTPPERLLAVMTDIVGSLDTHRGHVRSFYEHVGLLPPDFRDRIAERRDHYALHVEAILVEGRESGDFSFEDARMARLGIFGMCGWTHTWYKPGGGMSTDEIARHLWRLTISGIGSPSGRRRRPHT